MAGLEVASLYGSLVLDTGVFDSGLRSARGALDSFGGQMQRIGGDVTRFGTQLSLFTAPLLAGFGAATAQAMNFDEAMTNVGAVLGRSADQMTDLNEQILAIGSASRFGPQAAAEAFYDVVGGVADASTHMAILNAAIATAEAGNADLGGTTSALISVMNAYGFSAEEAMFASDMLTQTVAKGVGTMDEFASALPRVATLAAANDIELGNLASSLAYLTTKGNTASDSATQLTAIMTAFLNPNAQMTSALEAMGLESGSAGLEMYGLAGMTGRLQTALGGSTDAMAGALGSVEALRGAITLNEPAFEDFIGNFEDTAEGATTMAQQIQNASEQSRLDHLTAQLSGLGITIGDAVLPVLDDLITKVTPIIGAIMEWVSANPVLVQQLVGLGLALVVAGPLIAGAGMLITAIGTAASVAGAALAVLTSPAFLIAGAFAAIMAAGGTLDDFLTDVSNALPGLKEGFQEVWMAIKPIFNGGTLDTTWLSLGLTNIGKALQSIAISAFDNLTGAIEKLTGLDLPNLTELGTILTTFKDKVIEFLAPLTASVLDGLTRFGDGLSGFLTNLSGADTSGLGNIATQLLGFAAGIGALVAVLARTGGDALGGILGALGDTLPTLGTGLAQVISAFSAAGKGDLNGFLTGIGNGLVTIADGVRDFAIDSLVEIADAIGNLIGLDVQGGLAAWGPILDQLPMTIAMAFEDIMNSLDRFLLTSKLNLLSWLDQLRGTILGATGIDIAPNLTFDREAIARQLTFMDLAGTVESMLREQTAGGALALDTRIEVPGGTIALTDPSFDVEALAAQLGVGGVQAVQQAIDLAITNNDDVSFMALLDLATELGFDREDLIRQFDAEVAAASQAQTFAANLVADITVLPGFININAIAASVTNALNNIAPGAANAVGTAASAAAAVLGIPMPPLASGGMLTNDGPAYLHAGEVVLNPAQARDYYGGGNGGGGNRTIIINAYGSYPHELLEMLQRTERDRG